MLHIHFGPMTGGVELYNVDKYFNTYLQQNKNLVDCDFAREVLMDVEGTKVISNYVIETKYLGIVSSEKICGGVKAILLLKNKPEVVIDGSQCGDNCAKWIQQIGREQDITITLYHIMKFKEPFEAVCLNTGKKMTSFAEYLIAYLAWHTAENAQNIDDED